MSNINDPKWEAMAKFYAEHPFKMTPSNADNPPRWILDDEEDPECVDDDE